ncbi:hypothetical protein QFC21_005805 [Naganishia friedmannii]|uniref:Uncharacterized protein n=1 Tax=Naganishia friedmannii TaxID=89922 RepID=A0ACC2V8X6_9TREE|nr:hypothetical protein QFC21_005805 [Naganishia friedmannii]
MFFSEDFLMVKPGGLAATLGSKSRNSKHLNKKQIQACDIPSACEQIMNPPQPIALRTSAGLMVGVVKIHDARYDLFVHDVSSLESAVKRATLETAHAGGGGTGKHGNVTSANGANARVETITVQHQPGQGFAPNLDLEQASWEKFLRGYGQQQRALSIDLGGSQEETGSLDDSGMSPRFFSYHNSSANVLESTAILTFRRHALCPRGFVLRCGTGRARSRSATPDREQARNINNLPRHQRHRSSSLLLPPGLGRGQGSDDAFNLDQDLAVGGDGDAILYTPPLLAAGIGLRAREGTDSLLRPRASGGFGGSSVLFASGGGGGAGGVDSSFSTGGGGEGGVDYAPVDLGFDLGLDLPPMEPVDNASHQGGMMEVDEMPLDFGNGDGIAGSIVVDDARMDHQGDGAANLQEEQAPPPTTGIVRLRRRPRLLDPTIECSREELEAMKTNYKTRMISARYQKLVEEERKQVVEAARTGIAQPFGEQGKSLAVSIAPELVNFWAVVSARPYKVETKVVPERRKKAGTGRVAAGNHHDFGREQGDLDLPLGDEYDVGLDLGMQAIMREIEIGRRASGVQMPWELMGLKPASDLGVEDYYAAPGGSSTVGTGTGPRHSLATPQNIAERIARRARSSSILGSNISGSAQRRAMLGDDSMLDEEQLDLPDEGLPLDQDPLPADGPSQSSLPGNVNVNERQFLDYLQQQSESRLPDDDDDDVFGEDGVVDFSEIARPSEHKKAIAVNAFVSPLLTKNLISVNQQEAYGGIEIRVKRPLHAA